MRVGQKLVQSTSPRSTNTWRTCTGLGAIQVGTPNPETMPCQRARIPNAATIAGARRRHLPAGRGRLPLSVEEFAAGARAAGRGVDSRESFNSIPPAVPEGGR